MEGQGSLNNGPVLFASKGKANEKLNEMECSRATLAKINFHAYVGRPLNLMMEERQFIFQRRAFRYYPVQTIKKNTIA